MTSESETALITIDDKRRVLNGRIPASIVTVCTEALQPDERDAIRWFHAHYWDEGYSLNEVGDLIGYDGTSMSRLFRGEYEGKRAAVVDKIEAFRAELKARNRSMEMPWQLTELGKEIQENCDIARNYQAIVSAYGESQTGKTKNLRHIERQDKEGTTLLLEIPPGATEGEFVPLLCSRISLSSRSRIGELWLKIAQHLSIPGMLLMIDEGARAGGVHEYGGGSFKLLERIRWLQERCGLGVFFCGTNISRDQIQAADHAQFLKQWNRRVLRTVQLPDLPSRTDLNVFSRYYGLPAATGDARVIEKTIVSDAGLGQWLKTLAMGRVRAEKAKEKMEWEHVLRSNAWMKRDGSVKRRELNTEK